MEYGVDPSHIVRLGKEDNFWEHGSGPCGPCSEIYFDRGEKYGCGSPDCKPGCDCDRYMEIWNNVFSQFNNDGHGNYTELKQKNIDTGMGLERLACVMQGVDNMFLVDTNRAILDKVSEISGKKYGDDTEDDISIRVCTDHIKSAMFMIADGVIPSNEGRGYVLRRIIRRALRHGKLLGINHPFLVELCEVAMDQNKGAYPELAEKHDYILKVLSMEEERFDATIDAGLSILSNLAKRAMADGIDTISGEEVFKLYDTFGFPIDLTREILAEKKLSVDDGPLQGAHGRAEDPRTLRESEHLRMERTSRRPFSLPFRRRSSPVIPQTVTDDAKVVALIVDDESVERVSEGDCTVILDKTPFYGEGGGQVGDSGTIYDADSMISVTDTKKIGRRLYPSRHDSQRRYCCRRHHPCRGERHPTHLHKAQSLSGSPAPGGSENHSRQSCRAGGLACVDETRCRFDFTHYAALTPEELDAVETLVNAHILLGEPVVTTETTIDEAKKQGAMALFGEKYGDTVRMVRMGNFSTELCGGTHVDNTAKIGLFRIVSESSVAAGVQTCRGYNGHRGSHRDEEEGTS